MPKLKITIQDRKRALDLLTEGHTVESAVGQLHRNFHSESTAAQVKRSYFPSTGYCAIHHLVGRPRAEIEARFNHMVKMNQKVKRQGSQTLKKLFEDAEFRSRHAERNRQKWRKYFANPEQRKKHSERARRMLEALHKDPNFRATHAKKWQDPVFRARVVEQARQTLAKLNADPAFRAARVARLKALWRDPHYRTLQQARTKLRWHRYKLQRALNFFEAQQPGGWEAETGGRERRQRRIAVHVPQMEEAIDRVRAMRKMLAALPGRQRVLLSRFFGIEMKHSDRAIREARDLRSWEVGKELKGALETLKQHPAWKELLEE